MSIGRPGDVVAGRYRLEECLGAGGMGVVFRARDLSEDKLVALKRMKLEGRKRASTLRFQREFHTLASLRHPRIVEAYDYGVDDEGPFYTMELVAGRDLRDEQSLGPEEIARVLRDIASALALLHARGLVHRDLSPRNVRLDASKRAKLIDFGMLGTTGLVGELGGTLPYIAPEVFRGLPVDGRTDLYALGVIGYRLLTRRTPYRVDTFDQDPELTFASAPVPPSSLAPDTPQALDAILLALLAADPSARTPSAATVIDALGSSFDLPAVEVDDVARSYLASVAMVGRRRELASLRRRIRRAVNGRGSGLVLRAESGTGKSRLLREAALEAKLAGALPLVASCETASAAPYATLERIAESLFVTAPDVALAAAKPRASALATVFPALSERLGGDGLPASRVDPGEDRMRLQRALLEWLLEVSTTRPLVLLVDDIQRCDEASCAVLAALMSTCAKARMFVVLAERVREEVRAPKALASIRSMSKTIDLEGLSLEELRELVVASVGDVPHVDRLAERLRGASAGIPLVATEMLRQLVDRGTVRWVDGTWVIPTDLPAAETPATLASAVDQRLERLDEKSLRLGEALALHGGGIGIERAVTLGGAAGLDSEAKIFGALDTLAREGVLVAGDDSYRFRHDGFKEGLARLLDDDRRRALHLAIGEAVLARETLGPDDDAKIGWHLLEGGETRGAELLAKAGERLFRAQALADCIAPLEASLRVFDRSESAESKDRATAIAAMLLAAGWVSNRVVGSRHARRVIDAYRLQCGFDVADAWSPRVGGHLSLLLGFVVATVRWIAKGGRGFGPVQSMSAFAQALAYGAGLANAENRVDDLLALVGFVAPMRVFPVGMPRAVYLFILGMPDVLLGKIKRGQRRFSEAIDRTARDRWAPVSAEEKAFAEVAMRGLRLLLDVNQFDPRVDADLAVIDASPFRYYHLVAEATRCIRHRYRGEEDRALRVERKMEVASLQLGSWSTDVQILFFAHPAYALCNDALGLRRSLEALEALAAQGFLLDTRIAITRADYLRTSGRASDACELLRPVVAGLRPDDLLMKQWAGSSFADALLVAGELEECIAEAEKVIALDDEDTGVLLPRLRAMRCLGAAMSLRGQHREAIERLEPAIAVAESIDCPPLAGQLHETRARVALATNDREGYAEHGAAAIRWLRPTRNPSLLALCERLVEEGRLTYPADTGITAEWAVTAPAPSGSSQHLSGASTSGPSTPESDDHDAAREAETRDALDPR